MSEKENIGGVTFENVICFQTKIMLGKQFKRILKAKEKENVEEAKKDIIIACLRVAWNDAFRHVSENEVDNIHNIKDTEKEYKNENYKDYYSEKVLNSEKVFEIFWNYSHKESTKEKVEVLINNIDSLNDCFKIVKKLDGEKGLCFGHYQKLFNMALKYYLCLYMCREELEIKELFHNSIVANLKNADCPIDSVILGRLGFDNVKWSKIGTNENGNVNEYIDAQSKIGEERLAFDFKEWN